LKSVNNSNCPYEGELWQKVNLKKIDNACDVGQTRSGGARPKEGSRDASIVLAFVLLLGFGLVGFG
jgi:hypothetical protein